MKLKYKTGLEMPQPVLISKLKRSESVRSRQRKKTPIWQQVDLATSLGTGRMVTQKQ